MKQLRNNLPQLNFVQYILQDRESINSFISSVSTEYYLKVYAYKSQHCIDNNLSIAGNHAI